MPASAQQTFSPLFIGEVSSTDALAAESWTSHCFQSPLHRGSLFNSMPYAVLSDRLHFQSPLHRGVSLTHGTSWRRDGVDHFSPLFIGEASSTSSAVSRSRQLFDPLSVPSSSGKSLQRRPSRRPALRRLPAFSPLFIGEVSSTYRYARRHQSRSPSFSPLFIGEVLFNGCQRSAGGSTYAFSPLFIGEALLTPLLQLGLAHFGSLIGPTPWDV